MQLDNHGCWKECHTVETKNQPSMTKSQKRVAGTFSKGNQQDDKDGSSISAAVWLKHCTKPAIYMARWSPTD